MTSDESPTTPPLSNNWYGGGHTHTLMASLSLGMGAGLILGGPQRISSPAYEVIANLGGCYVWGSIYFMIGALLLGTAHGRNMFRWALLAGAVAYAVLAVAFTVTAFRYPDSMITAIIAYGWISAVHIIASERTRTGLWRTWPLGYR